MKPVIGPMLRALAQLDDRVFLGVVVRGVLWAALCFALLVIGAFWGIGAAAPGRGAWGWLAEFAGSAIAILLALWFFVPVAAAIGALYVDRVAARVEARWYPGAPPAVGASIPAQAADAVGLGLRVLALSVLALVLALALPGIGAFLAWAVSSWALGRGLFMAVAMRRMSRAEARTAYRRARLSVFAQGGMLSLAALLPPLNLLVPVVGTAAMVHVLQARHGLRG